MHDPRLSALFERYRRQSDLSALAKLFDEISPEMMRVARHVAGRGVDPEDVVQSTFLASIERADAFDATRPIVPWLMGILINQARLMNRRRATRHEEAAAEDLSSDAPIPDDAEANEVRDAVARALADLPPTYREVLVAHLAEGKPPHEIARELGRPQGTVRAQLHRGLRLVRRSLPAGFSFGLAALLDSSALASVRSEVLEAAARAKSLPPSAIPVATSTSKVGLSVAAASVVLAAIVGIAWIGGRSAHADQEIALGDAEKSAAVVASANVERPDRDARAAIRGGEAVAPARPAEARAAVAEFGSVRVTVRDAREIPIPGAQLDLLAWGDPLWHERVRGLVTGPDGTAEFPRVHVGNVGVHLDGGGVQSRGEVHPGALTEIVIQLERGLDLSGVVVDEHGRPIAGAIVEAGEEPGAAPRRVSEPTGADGRYVLPDVARTLAVWAREDSRPSSEAVWLGTPTWTTKHDAEVRFVLPDPAALLEFVVVDPRGSPIAGAVSVGLEAEDELESSFRSDGSLTLAQRAARAVSDASGHVRLAVDRARVERVAVSAAGFAPREVDLEDVGSLVALAPGGRLVGVARFEDGVAAEESTIEATFEGQRAPLWARSGPDGSWEIRDAPPGPFTLRARAAPVASATEMRGSLRAGETVRWNPVLAHASVIRGIALSANGTPAKTWLVKAVPEDASEGPLLGAWMRSPRSPARQQDLRQCYTDPDGKFAVPCASGATYRIELRARKRWDGPVQGALSGVPAGARDVELRAQEERGFVRARFVDAAGRPSSGNLSVVVRNSGAEHRSGSKPDGGVECVVHPGTYTIVVWPDGGAPRSLGTREVGADQVVDVGDVRVDATGTLTLRGAARARIALRGADGLLYHTSRSGADLVATGLPAGEYVATGQRADGSAIESRVRVESGAAMSLQLE